MTHTSTKRYITIGTILSLCLAALTYFWFSNSHSHFKIEPFVYERDMQDVLNIFDTNWYWLIPTPKDTYSPHYLPYVFKYRSPGANPKKHGDLQIHVIRKDNHVAGFTAFYKKTKHIGQILFVAVEEQYRGKGLGDQLFRYAMNTLIKQGATQLILLTRTDNAPAQRLYKRSGFKEAFQEGDEFVWFSYTV